MHNKLIDTMLSSPALIIATMRSKTEYVQTENERGYKEIRKVGLAPVQREGMDYEFGVVFDLGVNHLASVSKDRTGIFDEQIFKLSQDTGKILRKWLDEGVDIEQRNRLYKNYLEKFGGDKDKAQTFMLSITDGRGSKEWTQEDIQKLEAGLLDEAVGSEQ